MLFSDRKEEKNKIQVDDVNEKVSGKRGNIDTKGMLHIARNINSQ